MKVCELIKELNKIDEFSKNREIRFFASFEFEAEMIVDGNFVQGDVEFDGELGIQKDDGIGIMPGLDVVIRLEN